MVWCQRVTVTSSEGFEYLDQRSLQSRTRNMRMAFVAREI